MSHNGGSSKPGCFVCGSNKIRQFFPFDDESHWVDHCRHCKTEILRPLPTPQELRKYYEGYGTTKTPEDQVEFLIDKSVAYFEGFFDVTRFDRRSTATSTFLEVGFGNGASLMAAAKLGFKAYGLDMDPECTRRVQEIACQHAQTVHSTIGEISYLDPWLKFDVIKASQVIEHTLDPLEFLAGLAKHQS